jgi:acyl carrier protein
LFIVGACPHSEAEDLEMTATQNDELSSRIRKLLERELACDVAEIADDTPLVSSGLLDSVSIAFLLSAIEETEGIGLRGQRGSDLCLGQVSNAVSSIAVHDSKSTTSKCMQRRHAWNGYRDAASCERRRLKDRQARGTPRRSCDSTSTATRVGTRPLQRRKGAMRCRETQWRCR